MSEITENKITDSKLQYRIELFSALIITGIVCAAGSSNLLFASNDLYPAATDAMGHMAKVQYITQCLKGGVIPSWFPYWYNGAAVTQYYPPLSYYLMVPVYALTGNVMLTFKINCFLMMFIGGMGVWYFCRKVIGKWCGCIAIVFYCLQPFLLSSLYIVGVLAQGPVYAITPWLLYLVLSFIKEPNRRKALFCTIATALLILSHPMHAFIIVLCIMLVLLMFIPSNRISLLNYTVLVVMMTFSLIITAFWSLVGVTGLENPTIPYILPGVAANVTATLKWFQPGNMGGLYFYFALPILVFTVIAAMALILRTTKKQVINAERFEIPFCITLTFFTTMFSFGRQIPGFKLLPMTDSLLSGRILSLTALTGAIACAYLTFTVIGYIPTLRRMMRLVILAIALSAFVLTIVHINPYKFSFPIGSYEKFEKRFESVAGDISVSPFDKGRYIWFSGLSSDEANIPIAYGFTISEGWNMEGSPHNRALWNHLLCIATDTRDYLAKNFAFWNVRYFMLPTQYDEMVIPLKEHLGFRLAYDTEFYTSQLPSSYFLTDRRNGLIFGIGAPGVAMEFPYLVYEQRRDISDYSLAELSEYKLIYLCEPVVDTMRQKERIEETIKYLIDKGVRIIIEPTPTKGFKLFDVAVSDVPAEDSLLLEKQYLSPLNSIIDNVKIDEKHGYFRALFGLDEAYYKSVQNGGLLQNDIIGTKRVGKGEVLFLGMHLSQYLKAVYALNLGVPEDIKEYPSCSDEIKTLFEDIFKTYEIERDFWPDPFPVNNVRWNYKGVDFDYSSQAAQEMTISITYTPRWKVTIDGKPSDVGQHENLITLQLPAGGHKVQLKYGLTKYAVIGYTTLITGLLLLFLFTRYYDINISNLRKLYIFFKKYFQV